MGLGGSEWNQVFQDPSKGIGPCGGSWDLGTRLPGELEVRGEKVTLSTILHALLDLEQRKQGVQRISCKLN